jgi:hypothetical protein
MTGAVISGVVGQIRWAYYVAAAVNGYTVTRSADGVWALSANVIDRDAFKLAQRPLTFVALHEKGAWTWPITSIVIHPDTHALTATLGPLQE